MNHHLNRTLFSLGVLVAALSVAQGCSDDSVSGGSVHTPCSVEGETSCNGLGQVLVCTNGVYEAQSCGEQKACLGGQCVETCKTETFSISCDAAGNRVFCDNGFVSSVECASGEVCVSGVCKKASTGNLGDPCNDDFVASCDGTDGVKVCKDGVITRDPCLAGQTCVGNACVTDTTCDPGTYSPSCNEKGETQNCVDGKIVTGTCTTGTCYLGKCEDSAPCSSSTFTPSCYDDKTQITCKDSLTENTPCAEGEVCEGGVCQTIAGPCDDGSKECTSEHIVRECVDGAWHAKYCDMGKEVCAAGQCYDISSAESCVEAEYRASCDGDAQRICVAGHVAKIECGEKRHCEAGICYDDIAVGDDCDSETFVRQCLEDGTLAICQNGKVTSSSCGNKVCSVGACVPCTDVDFKPFCDASGMPVICQENGELGTIQCSSEEHCEDGACVKNPEPGDECDPATFKQYCDLYSNALLECLDNGEGKTVITLTPCPGDHAVCSGNKCLACDPSFTGSWCAKEGEHTVVTKCNADGTLQPSICPADRDICFEDGCAQCDPGKFVAKCDGNVGTTCNENGELVVDPCEAGELCRDGLCTKNCDDDAQCPDHYACISKVCVFQPECTPSSVVSCNEKGNGTRQCVAPGLYKDTACAADQTCLNGKCVGTECVGDGSNFCKDNAPAKCVDGYLKPIADACTGLHPSCIDGVCQECNAKTDTSSCNGNVWYQCTASNTYDKTPCLLNETCNATKGCVSKCGEGFKPSCEGNKRVYCSNEGAIVKETCNYDEVCTDGQCKSVAGQKCDWYSYKSQCVTDSLGNVYVIECDEGTNGIVVNSCNGSSQFCGTLAEKTGCFVDCSEDINATWCSNGEKIGPCVQGKDYLGNARYGIRTAFGYCKPDDKGIPDVSHLSMSCNTDPDGNVYFNHFYCNMLGKNSCEIATGSCGFASCATEAAACNGNIATNCAYDPSVRGLVQTQMDCSSLGLTASCVSYKYNGIPRATCKAEYKADTETLSTLGTCDGNTLKILTFPAKNTLNTFYSNCNNGCVTATNNGVTYAYCKK